MSDLVNPHADPVSERAYSLIFNGLTAALREDQWMPLSERARVSQAIYDSLRTGGLEVRFVDGLEMLRLVSMTMEPPA
ncbi:hypothetical protein M2302_000282 [Micromonospora sp. A200]|uniref:hypothetical protein n=1 Tax=Micromonospora sp. A200 TaxID=2940568 RepID=UPI0024771291|nr:hypothetical protein [Micromonospora sp. A200]MDH6460131.1 hypothetical protein [Micromonospora sp. A200]